MEAEFMQEFQDFTERLGDDTLHMTDVAIASVEYLGSGVRYMGSFFGWQHSAVHSTLWTAKLRIEDAMPRACQNTYMYIYGRTVVRETVSLYTHRIK